MAEWISIKDHKPKEFVSVLGYMTDAGEFPSVRECYRVGEAFFFPALNGFHPVDKWSEMPQPPKEKEYICGATNLPCSECAPCCERRKENNNV